MAAGVLGLSFGVGEELVDFVDERVDLVGEIVADANLIARADRGDFAAHAAQRPQPVERLQGGEHEQPEAEHRKAAHQHRAQVAQLGVDRIARLCHLVAPADLRSGQFDIALEDAQRLVGEFVAVALVEVIVDVDRVDLELAIP